MLNATAMVLQSRRSTIGLSGTLFAVTQAVAEARNVRRYYSFILISHEHTSEGGIMIRRGMRPLRAVNAAAEVQVRNTGKTENRQFSGENPAR